MAAPGSHCKYYEKQHERVYALHREFTHIQLARIIYIHAVVFDVVWHALYV